MELLKKLHCSEVKGGAVQVHRWIRPGEKEVLLRES